MNLLIDMWRHDKLLFLTALGVILALIGAPFAGAARARERDRLLAQCVADGHQEYECVSLLRNRVPIR